MSSKGKAESQKLSKTNEINSTSDSLKLSDHERIKLHQDLEFCAFELFNYYYINCSTVDA